MNHYRDNGGNLINVPVSLSITQNPWKAPAKEAGSSQRVMEVETHPLLLEYE